MQFKLIFIQIIAIQAFYIHSFAQGQLCFTGGGSGNDQAQSMVQSNDGGYIMAGNTSSYGVGGTDCYVMKTNSSGATQWTTTVGGSGNDYAYSIVNTFDGGVAICGSTSSFGAGGDDVYLSKLDASGNLLWSKTYGGTGADQGWELVQTPDSGFCIAGQTSSFGVSPTDFYVVRTDANGSLLWDKKIGASGEADIAYAITNTNDGGFAVAGTGYTWTGTGSTSSNDFYIVKLDANGNMTWSRLVQDVNTTRYPDYARSIIQSADGGYMIAGEAGQPKTTGGFNWHYLMVKLNPAGQVVWNKYYGGTSIPNVSTDGSDYAESVVQMPNGDYLVGGYTFSFNYNFTTNQQVGLEYYLTRVSESGTLLSTQIIGTANNDMGKSLIKTNDGGYAMAGYSQAITAGTIPDEMYVVKLDANLNTCCTTRNGGQDRGSGPTNTTRGASLTAGGTVGTGGTSNSGGSTVIICGQVVLNANFLTTQTQLCQSQSCVNFSDLSSGSPSSWSWSFPGASPATSNVQNPTNICYSSPGTYSVTLIVNNGVTTDTMQMNNYITVSPSPATPVISASGPLTFCAGDSVILTSSYPAGNTWSPTASTNQSIVVSNSGTYSVTYLNPAGCSVTSAPIVVSVNSSPPAPTVSPTGPLIICSDGSIVLFSSILGGNTWSPGGETSDSIVVFGAGNYYVTNSNGNCSGPPSNIVVVNLVNSPAPPVITLGANDTLFSSAGATYQWYLNGNLIPGATSSFYVPSASGNYSVSITNEDNCNASSTLFAFELSGLSENESDLFQLSPNPVTNQLQIISSFNGFFEVQIFDVTGKIVTQVKDQSKTLINLTNIKPGVYFVRMTNASNLSETVRIIKER